MTYPMLVTILFMIGAWLGDIDKNDVKTFTGAANSIAGVVFLVALSIGAMSIAGILLFPNM